MTDRMPRLDPCTQEARENGCTCRMSSVNSATPDPPEPIINRYCPLHGWPAYDWDPDKEYERRRGDNAWQEWE